MSVGFAQPWWLVLLLAIPAWWAWARRRPGGIAWSRAEALAEAAHGSGSVLGALPDVLRALSFALLVIALAGPRTGAAAVEETSEGIAIMLAVDVSPSMLAMDLRPRNRLGAAQQTVSRFIRARGSDRIGLVTFGGEAMTRVPLTTDDGVLLDAVRTLRAGTMGEGTAIGEGLAAAANRLRRAAGEGKVIVLMSDGANNRGEIDPRTAAAAAAALGIRVYTIAMGTDAPARMPVVRIGGEYARVVADFDEALLTEVASATGGRYYRARDTEALARIYGEIDRLERAPVRVRRYVRHRPWHLPFLLLGTAMLLGEWLFRATRWGRVP